MLCPDQNDFFQKKVQGAVSQKQNHRKGDRQARTPQKTYRLGTRRTKETVVHDRPAYRLYNNHFLLCKRLVSRERQGNRIKKRYDAPRTLYAKLMKTAQGKRKERLAALHARWLL